jgi:hypothetical protein
MKDIPSVIFKVISGISEGILLQIPPDIPKNSNALGLDSASDILLYIILPLTLMIIATYWYYKKTTKKGSGQK